MCYEDIRIGFRRQARQTAVQATTTAFRADSNRVGIIIALQTTIVGDQYALLQFRGLTGNLGNVSVGAGSLTAALRFEDVGSLVQESFSCTSTGNAVVTEILDNDLARALKGGDPLDESK